jgi:hypothetical protein
MVTPMTEGDKVLPIVHRLVITGDNSGAIHLSSPTDVLKHLFLFF